MKETPTIALNRDFISSANSLEFPPTIVILISPSVEGLDKAPNTNSNAPQNAYNCPPIKRLVLIDTVGLTQYYIIMPNTTKNTTIEPIIILRRCLFMSGLAIFSNVI